MRVMRRVALAAVVVAAAVSVAACTGAPDPAVAPDEPVPAEEPEPAAPLGLSVGVVLPPTDALDPRVAAQVQRELEALAASSGPELRGVQVLVPSSAAFAGDLAALLADRGTQLVCLLGPGAAEVARTELDLHPELDFCAAPADPPEVPLADLVALELRVAELGYAVGVAAAMTADDGPIGLVLGSAELPNASFRTGLQAAVGDREVVTAGGGGPLEDVEEVLAAGASVVVLDPGGDADPALDALTAAEVPVLVPEALLADRDEVPPVVVSWRVAWAEVVASAIAWHLETTPAPATSHGFAEGTFTVAVGPGASPTVRAAVEAAVADLEAGTWDASAPPAVPPTGEAEDADADEPDADADDAAGEASEADAEEPAAEDADTEDADDTDDADRGAGDDDGAAGDG
jgi:hypothetical protein